ncbi:SDR family oxidoreductase [Ruegeria profundi]|uniref:SDR family oxidoreductase n=1 Tax=Ruegeria profundi TaxID=1685378 RepID=UPI003C7D9D70
MLEKLKGKRDLAIATSQGMGIASTIASARRGAKVYATDINSEKLNSIRSQNLENHEIFEMYVANDYSIRHGVTRLKPDVLFNGDGFVHHGTILVATDSEWDFAMDFDLRSIVRATKAAVVGVTKSVAVDFIAKEIRCNCVRRAMVDSPSRRDRVDALGEQLGTRNGALARFLACRPTGRVAKAEEIAAYVVYPACDESAFTTGHTRKIDGGWSAQ